MPTAIARSLGVSLSTVSTVLARRALKRSQQDAVQPRIERERITGEMLEAIRARMADLGVSQAALAKRMKCSTSNMSALLRSDRNLTVATLVDLAAALEARFIAPRLEPRVDR